MKVESDFEMGQEVSARVGKSIIEGVVEGLGLFIGKPMPQILVCWVDFNLNIYREWFDQDQISSK